MRQQPWGYAQQQLPQRPARRLCFPRFIALGAGSWKPTFSPTMPRPLTQVRGNHQSPSLRPPNQDGIHGKGRGFHCTVICHWRWQVGISRGSLGVLWTHSERTKLNYSIYNYIYIYIHIKPILSKLLMSFQKKWIRDDLCVSFNACINSPRHVLEH